MREGYWRAREKRSIARVQGEAVARTELLHGVWWKLCALTVLIDYWIDGFTKKHVKTSNRRFMNRLMTPRLLIKSRDTSM